MLLALALLIAPQTTEDHPTGRFLCDRVAGKIGPNSVWFHAKVELDRTRKVVERSLTVRTGDYRAVWDVKTEGRQTKLVIRSIEPDTLPIPRDAKYPINIVLTIDGGAEFRAAYDKPSTTLVDGVNPYALPSFIESLAGWRETPAVSFKPITIKRDLVGSRSIMLTVEDADSHRIFSRSLSIINWTDLLKFTDSIFPRLDQDGAAGRCNEIITTIVFD